MRSIPSAVVAVAAWFGLGLGLASATLGCGKRDTDEVLAKMTAFSQAVCACRDEPCMDRVEQAVRAYQTSKLESLRDEQASEAFMAKMLAISDEMAACASKYQLDAAAKFVLDGLKQDVLTLRAKLANGQADLTDCLVMQGAMANASLVKAASTRADVAAVLTEAGALCDEAIPLHVLQTAVAQAEAARAADATGKAALPACRRAALEMALEAARKTPAVAAKANALEARFLAACPKA